MLRTSPRSLLFLLLCFPSLFAQNDVVRLRNGDSITGVVKLDQDGQLVMATEYAGEIRIEWSYVESLVTEGPVPLQLKNGEHFKGVLVESDPGTLKVLSEHGGETEAIAIEHVDGIRLGKEDLTEADYWTGEFSAGVTISDGNSRSKTAYGRTELVRESEFLRLTLNGRSNYESESGTETDKNNYGALKLDVFAWGDLYMYGLASFEYDRFEGIDLRTILSGGFGYRLLRTEKHELDVELGLAFTDENRRRDEDISYTSLRAAAKWKWKITDRIRFRTLFEIYPNLEDFDDFLIHSESRLLVRVYENFNLEGAVIWDHDQVPPLGQKRNDADFILAVTYTF